MSARRGARMSGGLLEPMNRPSGYRRTTPHLEGASMRKLLLAFLLAALPATAGAATTTSTVKVKLKNSGVGTFSATTYDTIKVFANNIEYSAYDKTAYAPTSGSVTPGHTFYAQFSGLQVYAYGQGTYQFEVTFWDTDGVTPKKIIVGAGTRFPGTGSYWVSKAGVTTYDPGDANAFDIANAAPPAASGLSCYPQPPNTATSMYVYWSLSPQPGDLQWARGTTVTPHGPVHVSWEIKGDRMDIHCEAPKEVNVQFKRNDSLQGLKVTFNGKQAE
jgi:hypothetical protein